MKILITLCVIVCIFLLLAYVRRKEQQFGDGEKPKFDPGLYQKKKFLFDTVSEYHFFPLIQEIVGPDYVVFTQVNYGHLIEPRAGSYTENRRYRSHLDRQSADFIICDRKTCTPRLVINLDGSVHNLPEKRERDIDLDGILSAVGLPILRLSNEESTNRDFVKEKVLGILNP